VAYAGRKGRRDESYAVHGGVDEGGTRAECMTYLGEVRKKIKR